MKQTPVRNIALRSSARPQLLRAVFSGSLNVYCNLALEQQLYEALRPDEVVLLLWRNSPSVVIGRHQNPWTECDLQAMQRDGVTLARRTSGGGAVYHDGGNGNFSFLAGADYYDQQLQFSIVIAALAALGITAQRSGRNDILVDGRKFSGNAFRYRKEKSYHHGTVLIGANLQRLSAYLNPADTAVRESRAIASVRSAVVNLSDLKAGLQWPAVCEQLVAAAERAWDVAAHVERIDRQRLDGDDDLQLRVAELCSWQWIYGRTPDFCRVHRLRDGCGGPEAGAEFELELQLHRGCIADLKLRPQRKYAALAQRLRRALEGVRYRPEDLHRRASALIADGPVESVCLQLAQQLRATADTPLGTEEYR